MKKENALLHGKGEAEEWITVKGNHIPIAKGESKEEAVQAFIQQKQQEEIPKLDNTKERADDEAEDLKKTEQERKREERKRQNKKLVHTIKNFDPIPLKIGDKEILAEFDTFTANKNIFTQGNSDKVGLKWKREHIEQLPRMLKNIQYVGTSKETGKNLPQHKGVKQWHYFRLKVRDGKNRYTLLINVREKGKKFYIYEIKVTKRVKKKKKYKKRV